MTNKKLIITDLIILFFAICLYIVSAYIKQANTVFDVVVILSSEFAISIVIITNYQTEKKVSLLNVFVPLCLSFFLYGLFYLPAFGFISKLGLHNGVCGLFVFTLFSRCVFNIEFFIRNKTATKTQAITGNKTTTAGIICRLLRIYSIGILLGGMVLAIFNAFYPVIDMSIPYQLLVEQKTLNEIMSSKQF